MRTMADDGKRWVASGRSTPEEIMRVAGTLELE
jgi:type II secretory ATPase GspE/PulE/Tfp pilus assembly ATPase PilB-like protein